MKIKRVHVESFLGISGAVLRFDRPFTLIAGPNRAGKSSLLDAVSWALMSRSRGYGPKDGMLLAHDGEKKFRVQVEVLQNGKTTMVHRTRTTGTARVAERLECSVSQLEAVLRGWSPEAGLALLKPAELADLIRRGMATVPTKEELKEAGIAVPDAVRFALEGNWGGALRAAQEARLAAERASSEGETVDTYRDQRGDIWRLLDLDMADLEAQVRQAVVERDAVGRAWKTFRAHGERLAAARAELERAENELVALSGCQEDVERDQGALAAKTKERDDAEKALRRARAERALEDGMLETMPAMIEGCQCPLANLECPSGEWMQQWGSKHLESIQKNAKARAPFDEMESHLKQLDAEVELAKKAAQASARRLEKEVKTKGERDRLRKELAGLTQSGPAKPSVSEEAAVAEADRLVEVRNAARRALDTISTAESITDLRKQEAALKADGLPARYGRRHLDEFRDALSKIQPSGLRLEVTDDFEVTLDSRPVGLASRSEKMWCSLALQAAISNLSGLKILFVDEFEVFVGESRADATGYLLGLIESGVLDHVVCFASTPMKAEDMSGGGAVEIWFMDRGKRPVRR